MITGVSKVFVPVDDQEAALQFWTITLGFELITDQTYGSERWVEVTPPDRRVVLALGPRRDAPRHEPVTDQLPHSDLFFNCEDIAATHTELSARGVKFPVPPARQHFGWWALFEDNDGTRYALGQWEHAVTTAKEGMHVDKVLAAIAVSDWEAATRWYQLLFGRPMDSNPMPGLAEWHAAGGVVQLVHDRQRAGGSLITLWVPDIDATLKELAGRGGPSIDPDETTSDKVIFATLTDPDQNAITLVEVKPGARL